MKLIHQWTESFGLKGCITLTHARDMGIWFGHLGCRKPPWLSLFGPYRHLFIFGKIEKLVYFGKTTGSLNPTWTFLLCKEQDNFSGHSLWTRSAHKSLPSVFVWGGLCAITKSVIWSKFPKRLSENNDIWRHSSNSDLFSFTKVNRKLLGTIQVQSLQMDVGILPSAKAQGFVFGVFWRTG